MTVHLRIYPGKSPANLADALQTLTRIGAANLRLAPSTAHLLRGDMAPGLMAQARGRIGLWMAGQPALDLNGQLWSVHRPIANTEKQQPLAQLLAVAPDAPFVFDVLYENHDAEYLDASFVERLLPTPAK